MHTVYVNISFWVAQQWLIGIRFSYKTTSFAIEAPETQNNRVIMIINGYIYA